LTEAVTDADVVHVEARVVPNDEYPSLSSVTVDEEPGRPYSGSVFARSLGSSPARARLVTFEGSATRTVGEVGDSSLGFARQLIAAGVATVVSPVTDIADANEDETWRDFHRHYASGSSAAESLRRAQVEALSESNRRPGPWATLTVFGTEQ
jgi:CHAT domain-containing protein